MHVCVREREKEKDQCGNEKRVKRFSEIITAHCGSKISVEWWIVLSLKFLYGTAGTADAVDMHACMHVCVREIEREKDQRGNEKRVKRFSIIFTAHCGSNISVERRHGLHCNLQ